MYLISYASLFIIKLVTVEYFFVTVMYFEPQTTRIKSINCVKVSFDMDNCYNRCQINNFIFLKFQIGFENMLTR